jgi:hypothetical protein
MRKFMRHSIAQMHLQNTNSKNAAGSDAPMSVRPANNKSYAAFKAKTGQRWIEAVRPSRILK